VSNVEQLTVPQLEAAFVGLMVKILVFFDNHAGAISALATIAIGYFTFTLWRSTEATKSLAELALPRPHIFVRLNKSNILNWGQGDDKIIDISVAAGNYGQGPAIIERWLSSVFVQHDIPEQNKGLTIVEFHHDNVVKEGAEKSLEFPETYTRDRQTYRSINPDSTAKLASDEWRVYLCGIVHYRDIFSRRYETSYCVSYAWGTGTVQAEGVSKYNYQT